MSTDYTQAPLAFKVKKAIRYLGLYGVSRTLAKIRSQNHLKAAAVFDGPRWDNPRCRDAEAPSRSVAIIGCGNYSFSTIAYFLARRDPLFLRSAYDTMRSRSLSLCQAYNGRYAVADWKHIIDDPQVKLVYIASNHASHAEYAVACIEAKKDVHIEKPLAVTHEQLDRLLAAMRQHRDAKVFLGFNRPRSRLFRELQAVLARQSGPLMISWFIAGHEIQAGHWYYEEKEGGRVLGNLCHWTDLTLHLVTPANAFPCTIIPASPPGARSDCVVSVVFANQSCASITFSAKGHTFEGVREVLNVQKGDVLANLSDFRSLTYEVIEKKVRRTLRHRDHGHEANILHSIDCTATTEGGETAAYVEMTGRLVLAIKEAVDSGKTILLSLPN